MCKKDASYKLGQYLVQVRYKWENKLEGFKRNLCNMEITEHADTRALNC